MVIITDDTFKYDFEPLDSSSDEFKFIKDFINITATISLEKVLQIHKVFETSPTNSVGKKRNNLMLFHGTNERGVEGILKEGFKNSENGWLGKGVYMTDCSTVAVSYSRVDKKCQNNKIKFVFVNEVLKSETLKTSVFSYADVKSDKYTKPKHQFEQHAFMQTQQITKDNYKKDADGRRYRNVAHNSNSSQNEFVADESITIPRYLVELNLAIEFEHLEKLISFINDWMKP